MKLHSHLFLFSVLIGVTGMILTDLTYWAMEVFQPAKIHFFRNFLILSFLVGLILRIRSFQHGAWKTSAWLIPLYALFIIFQGLIFGMEKRSPDYILYYLNILTFDIMMAFILGASIRISLLMANIEKLVKGFSFVNGVLLGIVLGAVLTRLIPLSIGHYWILLFILSVSLTYWSLKFGNQHLNLQSND